MTRPLDLRGGRETVGPSSRYGRYAKRNPLNIDFPAKWGVKGGTDRWSAKPAPVRTTKGVPMHQNWDHAPVAEWGYCTGTRPDEGLGQSPAYHLW